MSELKRINLRIRPELHNWLKVSAEARGLSMNAMCILALETYLTQQKVTDNIDDLLKAWNEERENK